MILKNSFCWIIPIGRITFPNTLFFNEELQIEDDDGLLVENDEQHVLDIDDDE